MKPPTASLLVRTIALGLTAVSVPLLFGQVRNATESLMPTNSSNATPSAALAIKAVVYRDLLGKRNEDAAKLQGAYFLEASNDERDYLQSCFTNWLPRVEVGRTNDAIISKTGVIDRVTGKPGVLYWARVLSQTNATAKAVGGWHSSPQAGGQFDYELALSGTNWVIQTKKRGAVW